LEGKSSEEFGIEKLVIPDQPLALSNLLTLLKDRVGGIYRGKLSAIIFSCDSEPTEIFHQNSEEGYSIKSKWQGEIGYTSIGRKIKNEKDETFQMISGTFFTMKIESGIWVSITIGEDEFIEKVLIRFFDVCSPDISIMHYTSTELRKILQSFVEENELEAEVVKAVIYPFGGGARIDFDRKPMEFLFDKCQEDKLFVDKIRLELQRENKILCDVFTSRKGVFRFYDGDVDFFFRKFISRFAGVAGSTKKVLEKRERSFGSLISKPLAIDFENDVFLDIHDNHRFINALCSLDKSGVSVYHQNPYVHLSFSDFKDGSGYDVFAVSSNSVRIIPSYRSTLDSLMRISDCILDCMGEGQIKDLDNSTLQVPDFFED